MNKTEKTEMISEVRELLESSNAVYLADYTGINVEDINNLRNAFRKDGVRYKVYKNTLFKRALNESGKFQKLGDHLLGMTSYIFASGDNIVAPAKIIKKYFDQNQKLSLKACYIENEFYDGSQLNALATLPTKNDLIAGIIVSISAPASGIVGAINAVFRDLVSVIDEISKRKAA